MPSSASSFRNLCSQKKRIYLGTSISILLNLVASTIGFPINTVPSTTGTSNNSTKSLESTGTQSHSPIFVTPGRSIQELVDTHPPGTTFILRSGTYRLQQIKPKAGNHFIGEPGAILSGAKLLNQIVKQGQFWVARGQTQQGPVRGRCEKARVESPVDTCMFPEDLFFDDIPLTQVSSLPDLQPRKWFFDYAADTIYFHDNPHDHKVETSITPYAFEGNAPNVVIQGLVIEKYATPAQEGAIHNRIGHRGPLGKNWLVKNNHIRLNHAMGIRIGDGMKVIQNRVHHNGQYGIGGNGKDIVIEDNEISYNNNMGFHWHTAGGTKFVWTKNLIVRNNHVHHNLGPGLWTDINNINTLYENNRVQNNSATGIFHEISYSAIIRNNVVESNGFGNSVWLNGAGILISCSPDVEVYGNTVRNNADGIAAIQTKRGQGKYGNYEVKNLYIHHNTIVMNDGETGFAVKTKNPQYFTNKNNRFEQNSYTVQGSRTKYFRWMNQLRSFEEWQDFGHDMTGTFTRRSATN
ncbi:MAG: right-handed parallel beta-helix repeat-containing protein [Nitrospirales bacterium]